MRTLVVVSLLATLVAGCGVSIPTDPDGTLDRVGREQVVRAGAAPNRDWVRVEAPDRPSGHEVALVEDFAASLGAEVEWTVGTEEHLVTLLEDGEIDIAVGGFTDQNLWVDMAALTRPYVEVTVSGTIEKHVMMLPRGENAWQSELERWLDGHGSAP